MSVHIVMDRSGDTRHEFDPSDIAAVTRAQERFQELTGCLKKTFRRTSSSFFRSVDFSTSSAARPAIFIASAMVPP